MVAWGEEKCGRREANAGLTHPEESILHWRSPSTCSPQEMAEEIALEGLGF